MKKFYCFLLLIAASIAHSAPSCAPKTWITPSAEGSPYVEYWGDEGGSISWWCKSKTSDTWLLYTWAGLYNQGGGVTGVKDSIIKIIKSDNPMQTASDEIEKNKVLTTPGSLLECKYKELVKQACYNIRSTDFGPDYPGKLSADKIAQVCGEKKDCSTIQPSVTWRVPNTVGQKIHSVTTTGKLGLPISNLTAPANAVCDCSGTKTLVGALQYCPLLNGPSNQVTYCVKR